MQKITDAQAAELVLGLLPRIDFKGAELDALLALRIWATAKVEDARQPTLTGLEAA